jgi:hypothetical protein
MSSFTTGCMENAPNGRGRPAPRLTETGENHFHCELSDLRPAGSRGHRQVSWDADALQEQTEIFEIAFGTKRRVVEIGVKEPDEHQSGERREVHEGSPEVTPTDTERFRR